MKCIKDHLGNPRVNPPCGNDEINGKGNTMNYEYRNYDAQIGIFKSIDPLAEKYAGMSPYAAFGLNPISNIDPDGRYILFVNGLRLKTGAGDQPNYSVNTDVPNIALKGTRYVTYLATKAISGKPGIYKKDVYGNNPDKGEGYWNTEKENNFGRKANIVDYYKKQYNDENVGFTSGSSSWTSSGADSMEEGREKAKLFHQMVGNGEIKLESGEPIRVISHSQGGAHAAGFIDQLLSYGIYNVVVHEAITPHQPTEIINNPNVFVIQFSHPNDAVSSNSPFWLPNGGTKYGIMKNTDYFFGKDVMGGTTGCPCEGPAGNRCGHNVTDNDKMIESAEGVRPK